MFNQINGLLQFLPQAEDLWVSLRKFNNEVQGILIDGKVIPFNLFTAKQKKHILGFLDMTEHIKNITKISE